MDLTIDDNLIRELGLEKSEEIREKASIIISSSSVMFPVIPGVVYQNAIIALEIDGIKLLLKVPFKKDKDHDINN